MDELDEEQRVIMEGHRPGTYLRLRFTGVPCELMQHFDPAQPLLVGGVSASEEGVGFMQLRFKRHRWFPKILKTRDPLVFSIGKCIACLPLLHSATQCGWLGSQNALREMYSSYGALFSKYL
jgi:hypothetical protein